MSNESLKRELAGFSESWGHYFKDLNKFWTSAAMTPDFWGLGAEICIRHDIPPSLLIPLVHNFLNMKPSQSMVTFHCNVMKAESLIERAISNARDLVAGDLEGLRDVAIISGLPGKPVASMIDTLRILAALILENFRLGLDFLLIRIQVRMEGGPPVSLKDSLAYRACGNNPFLLCDRAEAPLARHVAYNNIRALLIYQPWLGEVWEGLVRGGHEFGNMTELAGPAPEDNPILGPNWTWPSTLSRVFRVVSNPPHPELFHPRLFLSRPLFNSMVSAYLSAKAAAVEASDLHLSR